MALPQLLIQRSDFVPYVKVAANLTDNDLNPRIREAQTFDLRDLLTVGFYNDFLANIGNPNYAALAANDNLKACLVYFTSARLLRRLDLHITPNATMFKRNEFSDHADAKTIAITATEYENLAISYFGEVSTYITGQGKAVFPLWPYFNTCNTQNTGSRPRIYGVSGQDTQGGVIWRINR